MIRWSEKDELKLKRAVRNFNAKLSYNIRKHPERASYLPNRLSVKELRKEFKAGQRDDFVKKITSIMRFSNRGYEMPYTTKSNVQMSLWEKKEIDNKFREINRERKRTAKMKRMEFVPLTHNIEEISPKNFEQYKSAIFWDKAKKKVLWRENYLKAVGNVFGKGDFYNFIAKTDADTLIDALQRNSEIMDITFLYEPREQSDKQKRIRKEIETANNPKLSPRKLSSPKIKDKK